MSILKDQWAEVYRQLGLRREFEEFHLRAPIIMPLDDDSGLWLIPVIAGVTMNKIFEGFEKGGIKVNDSLDLIERRDLLIESSFLVCTDGGANLPIRMASSSEKLVGLMSVQEYFLLNFWHLIARESCLDTSSVTVCSGTRLDGWRIPCVFFCSSNNVIETCSFQGQINNRSQPRLVYAF